MGKNASYFIYINGIWQICVHYEGSRNVVDLNIYTRICTHHTYILGNKNNRPLLKCFVPKSGYIWSLWFSNRILFIYRSCRPHGNRANDPGCWVRQFFFFLYFFFPKFFISVIACPHFLQFLLLLLYVVFPSTFWMGVSRWYGLSILYYRSYMYVYVLYMNVYMRIRKYVYAMIYDVVHLDFI